MQPGDKNSIAEKLIGDLIPSLAPIGESGCTVWRLDDRDGRARAYLKHGNGVLADAVAEEMTRLRWLRSRLPVPAILQCVATAGDCWLMTEAMAGRSARQLLDENMVDPATIVEALADFLRGLHQLPMDHCPFDARLERRLIEARARIDAGAVNEADFDVAYGGWSAEDVWTALQAQLPMTPDLTVTHGDYSLDNVLMDGARVIGCIDVGGAGIADRYHDIAICWSDLADYGVEAQRLFLACYGVGAGEQDKLEPYRLLNELF
jgi:aminoglycoside 3'-phosphotransferase I